MKINFKRLLAAVFLIILVFFAFTLYINRGVKGKYVDGNGLGQYYIPINFVGQREQSTVDVKFGPLKEKLLVISQPFQAKSHDGYDLYGSIIALYDNKNKRFWWSYQTMGYWDKKTGLASTYFDYRVIYTDQESIVVFLSVGSYVDILESKETVKSIEDGLLKVQKVMASMQPPYYSEGKQNQRYKRIIIQNKIKRNDEDFFRLPMSSFSFGSSEFVNIERTPFEWILTLKGSNPECPEARLCVWSNGLFKSFKVKRK